MSVGLLSVGSVLDSDVKLGFFNYVVLLEVLVFGEWIVIYVLNNKFVLWIGMFMLVLVVVGLLVLMQGERQVVGGENVVIVYVYDIFGIVLNQFFIGGLGYG